MHNTESPQYKDVVKDTVEFLKKRVDFAISAGIDKNKIIVDPGIGFGKGSEQNLQILNRLHEYKTIGVPVMVGTSRKSTIGEILELPVDNRIEGTAATVSVAITRGADMVRVHDVQEMYRISKMTDAIVRR
jgi:dihydropteroate synthase